MFQPSSSWHFGTVSCLRRYASSAALLWESQILNCRDVEQAVNSLSAPPGPFNLGNTAYLSQESTQDRQALYAQLVNSYKWTDKVCNCGIGSVFWQLFVATFFSLYHINIALLDDCLIFFCGWEWGGEGIDAVGPTYISLLCNHPYQHAYFWNIFHWYAIELPDSWLEHSVPDAVWLLISPPQPSSMFHDENCLPLATFFITGKKKQFQGSKFECRKE